MKHKNKVLRNNSNRGVKREVWSRVGNKVTTPIWQRELTRILLGPTLRTVLIR